MVRPKVTVQMRTTHAKCAWWPKALGTWATCPHRWEGLEERVQDQPRRLLVQLVQRHTFTWETSNEIQIPSGLRCCFFDWSNQSAAQAFLTESLDPMLKKRKPSTHTSYWQHCFRQDLKGGTFCTNRDNRQREGERFQSLLCGHGEKAYRTIEEHEIQEERSNHDFNAELGPGTGDWMKQWLMIQNFVALKTMYRKTPEKQTTYRTPKGVEK